MEQIQVKVSCLGCGSGHTLEVYPLDYEAWKGGALIQSVMPYLNAEQRELLISNTCQKCWDKMMIPPVSEEIDIEVKDVYGTEMYYVTSEHKKPIETLTKKVTIDLNDMQALNELGFRFQFGKQIKNEAVKKFAENGVNNG